MKVTLKSYVIGYALSVLLTLAAAGFVWINLRSGRADFSPLALLCIILILAVIQLFVQLIFFMHLGAESRPRWRLAAFMVTAGAILIIIVGAIWIMGHLNYNMMASPQQMETYIQSQDGF